MSIQLEQPSEDERDALGTAIMNLEVNEALITLIDGKEPK